jgi:SAM-dependent methyltransferase
MSVINDVSIDGFIEQSMMQIGRTGRLLDLGCGTQPYKRYYAGRCEQVVSADYSVRSKIDVRLSATALPFPDASFDVVLFSEVLEHVDEPVRAVKEIARVLKPGGRLLLTVPFNFMQHEVPHDHTRYTQFGLSALLRRHGLQPAYLSQRGSLLTLLVAQFEFLLRGGFETLNRRRLLKLMTRPLGALVHQTWLAVAQRAWREPASRNVHDIAELVDATPHSTRLRGARGHLRHWTLGFNVVAVRQGIA